MTGRSLTSRGAGLELGWLNFLFGPTSRYSRKPVQHLPNPLAFIASSLEF